MRIKKTDKDAQAYIYRRYIIKNGVKIYPKNAKAFKIPIR